MQTECSIRRTGLLLGVAGALAAGCASVPRTESQTLEGVVQVTQGFDRAGEGYFAPAMDWIVFQARVNGESRYRMFVAPVKIDENDFLVGKSIEISPDGSDNTCGYFSPDGFSLIFASTGDRPRETGPASGYQRAGSRYVWNVEAGMDIFRADGWLDAVKNRTGDSVNLAVNRVTDVAGYDAECAYSPDGQWIVFASNRHDVKPESSTLDLYAMRADGSDVARLTSTPGYDGGPFFSPDGKRLVYRSDRLGDDKLQIFVADLKFDGGRIVGIDNERQVTNDDAVNWGPFWHPGGRHIVYATSLHGHDNYELYVQNVETGRRCRITFTPGFDGLPVFSPDGKWLMWSSKRTPDGTTQLVAAKFKMPAAVK